MAAGKPRTVTRKSDAKDAEQPGDATTRSGSASARTRSQTAKQGLSMSSLLQTRSEAAVSARKPSAPNSPLPDIDSQDRHNPLAATEYANDIHAYYRRVEPKFRVSPDYMANQVRHSTTGLCVGCACATGGA